MEAVFAQSSYWMLGFARTISWRFVGTLTRADQGRPRSAHRSADAPSDSDGNDECGEWASTRPTKPSAEPVRPQGREGIP